MDEQNEKRKPTAFAEANFFSRIFFLFTFRSVQREFDSNVLYSPLMCHRSELLGDQLERSWNKQIRSSRRRINENALLKSILRSFWPEILKTVIISFTEIILRVAETVCLGFVLSYFQPYSTMTELNVSYWTIGMLASIGLRIFANAQQRCQSLYTSTKIRVACNNLVYRKVLRLKSKALQQDGGSKIITLIANDLSRCDISMEQINYVYTAPFVVLAVTYITYQDFGIPGLVGIICIISIALIQAFSAYFISKLQIFANQLTHERMRLMNVLLTGIRVVKMFVWEDSLSDLIDKARTKELTAIGRSFLLQAISRSVSLFIVPICIFLALYTVILEQQDITAVMVFVLICYYTLLNYIVSICFTLGLTKLFDICVVLKRVNKFLINNEVNQEDLKNKEYVDKVFIQLDNISATWDDVSKDAENDESFDLSDSTEKTSLLQDTKKFSTVVSILHSISLKIEGEQFLGIIGPIASGKSSLLQVILGELDISRGWKHVIGKISYASQVAWIFTSSIRQNILFGLDYDEIRYREVVRVCGLENDFRQFPGGDLTLIGDGGNYLSAGQRTRIHLARAVYRDADIYLLDDPFSGLDIEMANYLLDECILGFLENKCRIIATLHMGHLKNADNIIYLNNGRIEMKGVYEDLNRSCLLYDSRLTVVQHSNLQTSGEDCFIRDIDYKEIDRNAFESTSRDDYIEENLLIYQSDKTKLHKSGNVKKEEAVIFKYLLASNRKCALGTIILLFILNQIIISCIFYYLGAWTSAEEIRNSFQFLSPIIFHFFGLRRKLFYEYWFGILVIILIVATFVKSYFYSRLVKSDSKSVHDTLLKKVTTTHLRFYDITRCVQILNRSSRDLNIIDEELPKAFMESSQIILMTAGSFVLLILINTSFAIPTIILILVFVALLLIFSKCIDDISRMESKLFDQILDHLSIPVHGIVTSRALSADKVLMKEFQNRQDNYSSCLFSYELYSIALSFYLDLSCFIFVIYITVVLVLQAKGMDIGTGFIGLALTQAMSLLLLTQYGICKALDVKNQLKAVERISRFRKLKDEDDPKFSVVPPSQWPEEGKIVFDNVSLRYDTESPLVLENLSFVIDSGEKVSIVGLTGAGKSSIIAAMFRLFVVDGCIEIDGFDGRDISLKLLRLKISVIPQDPVLFAANLRFNLDPSEEYDDNVLYRAVQSLELKNSSGQLYGLDFVVSDRGSNLSVAQRQLICLARALIRKNKILILDEATQHVDPGTDASIQKTLRREFRDCTVLTISDRLNTVVNCDKVIVMESGKLQEIGHPHLLLQNAKGKFYEMILEAGPSEAEKLKKNAFENYAKCKTF